MNLSWDFKPIPLITVACLLAVPLFGVGGGIASGQALAVQPVTLQLAAGQKAATLTVTNRGTSETAIQLRAFAWNQEFTSDDLVPSDEILVSLSTIPPGETQIIRLVLRHSASERELTYRLLLDQIPPPAESGVVRVVLRLSIPVFAQPVKAAAARVQFHMENDSGKLWLVGVNEGLRHERFRDIAPFTKTASKLKPETNASPYILAGATRRWPVSAEGLAPAVSGTINLTAHGDSGTIEQQVSIAQHP